jgi:hypothetical protein
MDFNATGLPKSPAVYNAFTTFLNYQKTHQEDQKGDYPVRVAQLLAANAGDDATLISAALLGGMPASTFPILEKRFGSDVVKLLGEARLHTETGHAYIDRATDRIKVLCAASAIVSFDEFRALVDKMNDAYDRMPIGQQGAIPVVMMPDTRIFDMIGDAITDQTSCKSIETLYADSLASFKEFNEEHLRNLTDKGILQPDMLPSPVEFPAFEETGLLDDTKVRGAYAAICKDPRVIADDFKVAVAVAKTLCDLPLSKNPTAIAAALVDIGLRQKSEADFDMLEQSLDWDVVAVIRSNSVYEQQTPQSLANSSETFRQVALANMLVMVEESTNILEQILAEKDSIPPMQLALSMRPIAIIVRLSQLGYLPAAGTTGAPEIDAQLEQKTLRLREMLTENIQRKPQDPKPGKDMNGPSI